MDDFALDFDCGDAVDAMFDGCVPSSSSDLSIPRHTFWDRKGTDEWAQCDFDAAKDLKGVEVYWFDDEPERGWCRLPESWRVQWRAANDAPWQDIGGVGEVAKDRFCAVDFPAPVKAQAVRILVKLRPGFSGGILEWRFRQ